MEEKVTEDHLASLIFQNKPTGEHVAFLFRQMANALLKYKEALEEDAKGDKDAMKRNERKDKYDFSGGFASKAA